MWKVVYIAQSRSVAETIKKILTSEGLLVTLRPVGVPHFEDGGAVEVLVPESEAEEAHEILTSAVPV
jgi:hypothetical protein